jgi:hypothetical protein
VGRNSVTARKSHVNRIIEISVMREKRREKPFIGEKAKIPRSSLSREIGPEKKQSFFDFRRVAR